MFKFIAASWILIHYMLDLASDPNSAALQGTLKKLTRVGELVSKVLNEP